MTEPGEDLPTFGRFRTLERIGSGSMGVVYRAIDPESQREVALKTLRVASAEDDYRLKNEFRALVEIVHPNLVALHELFASERGCFFTMELVRGWPCTEWVQRRVTSLRESSGATDVTGPVLEVLRQLHAGLCAVHAAGQVHRDVKPSNAIVSTAGRLVLLDFGLAAAVEHRETFATGLGVVAGTLPYMAPEQLHGARPSPAMDWYAVGVLLHEMATGALPFDGPLREMQLRKERREVDCRRLPAALQEIVYLLLDPDPASRAAAESVAAVLARHGEPVARPAPPVRGEPFLGRSAELARLRAALDHPASERPSVVRVHGPSGIGKTRLIEQFLHEIGGRALVFRGRCHANETLPYKALDRIVDEISRYLLQLPESAVRELVPRHVAALLRLFPVFGRVPTFAARPAPLGSVEPQEIRRRGVAALRDLLGKLADRDQVVLWIDDLQWGDGDSARLIGELLHPPDPPGILLLLSYPSVDGGVVAFEEMLAESAPSPAAPTATLPIAPLGRDDAVALARALLGAGSAAPEDVVAQIAAESEGSPLLVAELADHLRAGRAPLDEELPDAVRLERLVLDRAATLPPAAREMLELVAVAGGPLEREVVLAACDGAAAPALIALLRQRLLVRDGVVEQRRTLETFHDRVRRAILASMPAPRQVASHRALAAALRRSATAAPEAIARHLHGAGDDRKAAEYAAAAGERAAGALAFLRAAGHYADAIAWRPDDAAWTASIRTRRADALVNAGHSAAAADEYLEAARSTPSLQSNELRRLACKQFLAAGRHDDAVRVLQPLLRELGLRYPRGGLAAFFGTLALTIAESMRRPAVAADERAIAPAATALFRVDVCDVAARGLIPVDAIRGVYFLLLGLRLARRAGEPGRYGRFLAGVGGSVLLMGPRPLRRRGRQMIEVAESIATRLDDSYIAGSALAARGQVALAHGDWREALRCSDAAAELEQGYLGVTFERNVARMASLRALEELGRLGEVARRAGELHRVASAAGDRYGAVTARLNLAHVKLAEDDPAAARTIAEQVLAEWSTRGFHIQHLYAHRVAIHAALYEGDAADAWRHTRDIWDALERSGLLFVPVSRLDALLLRARVQLAVAAGDPALRARLLGAVRRAARRIARQPRADAAPHGLVLEAACAALGGDVEGARAALAAAEEAFTAAGMDLAAAGVRVRRARLADAATARDAAVRTLREHGIVRPDRWLRVHAPGFADGGDAPAVSPAARSSESR